MDVDGSDEAAALPEPEATGKDMAVLNGRNVPLNEYNTLF